MAFADEFPIIPHMSAGVDCCGCIVPEADGDRVTLNCNECGASVGYINKGILEDMVMLVNAARPVERYVFAQLPCSDLQQRTSAESDKTEL
jgi:hypothetical protein